MKKILLLILLMLSLIPIYLITKNYFDEEKEKRTIEYIKHEILKEIPKEEFKDKIAISEILTAQEYEILINKILENSNLSIITITKNENGYSSFIKNKIPNYDMFFKKVLENYLDELVFIKNFVSINTEDLYKKMLFKTLETYDFDKLTENIFKIDILIDDNTKTILNYYDIVYSRISNFNNALNNSIITEKNILQVHFLINLIKNIDKNSLHYIINEQKYQDYFDFDDNFDSFFINFFNKIEYEIYNVEEEDKITKIFVLIKLVDLEKLKENYNKYFLEEKTKETKKQKIDILIELTNRLENEKIEKKIEILIDKNGKIVNIEKVVSELFYDFSYF